MRNVAPPRSGKQPKTWTPPPTAVYQCAVCALRSKIRCRRWWDRRAEIDGEVYGVCPQHGRMVDDGRELEVAPGARPIGPAADAPEDAHVSTRSGILQESPHPDDWRTRRNRRVRREQVGYAFQLADVAVWAIIEAARSLELEPLELARRLRRGELAELVTYLAAARHHVPAGTKARDRIDDVLHRVSNRMPEALYPRAVPTAADADAV